EQIYWRKRHGLVTRASQDRGGRPRLAPRAGRLAWRLPGGDEYRGLLGVASRFTATGTFAIGRFGAPAPMLVRTVAAAAVRQLYRHRYGRRRHARRPSDEAGAKRDRRCFSTACTGRALRSGKGATRSASQARLTPQSVVSKSGTTRASETRLRRAAATKSICCG